MIYLRGLWKQNTQAWGPVERVQGNLFNRLDKIGIDPFSLEIGVPFWNPGTQIDYSKNKYVFDQSPVPVLYGNGCVLVGNNQTIYTFQDSMALDQYTVISDIFNETTAYGKGILGFGTYNPCWIISPANTLQIYDTGYDSSTISTPSDERFTCAFVRNNTSIGGVDGYVNGIHSGTMSHADTITAQTSVALGNDDRAGNYALNGGLYNIFLFSTALNEEQVGFLSDYPEYLWQRPKEISYFLPAKEITAGYYIQYTPTAIESIEEEIVESPSYDQLNLDPSTEYKARVLEFDISTNSESEWTDWEIVSTTAASGGLSPNNITTSAIAIDSTGLGQVHSLSAGIITTSAIIIDNPTITEIQDLVVLGITSQSPIFGSPVVGQAHNLSPPSLVTESVVIEDTTLEQDHVLTIVGVTTDIPVIGTTTLSQEHVLSVDSITTGIPVIGTPIISEEGGLIPLSITTDTPVIGTTTLSQEHVLSVDSITTDTPVIGTTTLSQEHVLSVDSITTDSPVIGTITLVGSGGVIPLDITTDTPVIGEVSLGISSVDLSLEDIITDTLSVGITIIGQEHVLSFSDIITDAIIIEDLSLDYTKPLTPLHRQCLVASESRVFKIY